MYNDLIYTKLQTIRIRMYDISIYKAKLICNFKLINNYVTYVVYVM
jgi:hypothetical protein